MGGPSADGLLEAEGAMGAEGQTGGTGEGTSSSRLGIGDGEEATPRSTSSTPTSQRPPNSGKQILTPEAYHHIASPLSPSPQLHSAPDSASTSPPSRVDSVRVYAVRDLCMEFITELGCADVTEDAAKVQEQAQVTEESGEVVLAFLSKGRLCGIASLLRDGPRQEKYKSHESDVEPDDDDGNDLWDESSNENGGAYEVSEEDKSQDDGDDWVAWEEDFAEEEKMSEHQYFLKIRVWPASGYANIVLFDGGIWMSTTSYGLSWLSGTKTEKLALDMKVEDSRLVSNVVLLKSEYGEYEGAMVNSCAVEMFIQHNLSSLYDFNDQKLLGKGAYCNARLCTSRYDKNDYAIKIIKIREYDPAEPREVGILASLRSQHVVKFFQAWTETHIFVDYEECSDVSSEDDSRKSGKIQMDMQHPKYVLILMELCSGTLENYLFSETRKIDAEAWRMFKEILRGLQYIHGENVIHRDLKPANIFMGKDGRLKLGDFGQSCVRLRHVGPFKGTPYLGTIHYGAPELRKGENISEKVDVYSLGAIYLDLYTLFKTVFEKSIAFKTFKNDDGSSPNFDGDLFIFRKMIASDPLERPSIDDLLEYIRNCDAPCIEEK